jgi:hypothetical protein
MRFNELLETRIQVFRGESSGNRGGSYYTSDKEWARQFTQSGQDKEIKTRWIDPSVIFVPDPPVRAAASSPELEQKWEDACLYAKEHGYKAVQFDDGSGEPPSIYVLDKSRVQIE